ncbi:MAG: tetratricopeptide repeat protein [Thermodesulfovibrionia bacterium]|nr:tetratricopeptide repeat protein [Thermodesulfovibrionia bacterium]
MTTNELFREAQNLFIEGKHKESIESFTKAIDEGEHTEIAYLSRGVAYLQTKERDSAIADFSKAMDLNKKNHRAYYYRGISYMLKKDFEKAIQDFDRCIGLNSDNAAAFFARGTAYAELGKDDEAAKNLKTALINSEAALQGFADTFGVLRTQFDKSLALMTGERKPPSVELSGKETETLKKWLEE